MEISLLQFGFVVGVLSGILIGLVPLILGFVMGKRAFGIAGLALTIVAGTIFSLLGALPVAGLFIFLISRKSLPKVESGDIVDDEEPSALQKDESR